MVKFEFINTDLGYGSQKVLSNVNFSIDPGHITCLLGANGVGKTTLFKTVLGIIPPLSGKILLNGKPIEKYSQKEFAHCVAYVPQAHNTPFPYKVKDVVLFGRTVHLGMFSSPGKKDHLIVEKYLDMLEISYLANKTFTELSGGEKQMVIVARALAQEAMFIILDEPTSNLDYGNQQRIIQKIKSLKKQSIGILMATHAPDHAFMIGSQVIILDKGILFRSGRPDRVITSESLRQIYGIDVQIFDTPLNGSLSRKICAPVI